MIFDRDLARKVLHGQKTQARRIVVANMDCRYQPGRSYAIQPGTNKASIGRLLVTDLRTEPLGDLTFDDARREGFRTRDEFFERWGSRYRKVDKEQPVWVITFKLDDRETVRLLHKFSERGYTTERHEAMEDESEGVDAKTLERFAKDNAERFEPIRLERAKARREQRQELLDRLKAEAQSQSVNATGKLWRVRKALEEFDAAVYDDAA